MENEITKRSGFAKYRVFRALGIPNMDKNLYYLILTYSEKKINPSSLNPYVRSVKVPT